MRVFVTGASGHIGGAVVAELREHGHQVLGLARSDASAAKLQNAGAEVVRGDIVDLEVLQSAAQAADGVIHLAFRHDLAFTGNMAGAAASDLEAINTFGDALAGTGKPLVTTGGTMLLAFSGHSGPATERDVAEGPGRVESENVTIGLAERGVRSSVIRLSPVVHSHLDTQGFTPMLIAMARQNGFAGYVGEGQNRWPAVDTHDAAALYRLALERAPAGSRLHGVAEEGVPFRALAEAIAAGLGLSARSVDPREAEQRFGFLGRFVGADNPTSNAITRELLGWEPTHPDLIDDIAAGHYFA